MDKIKNKSWIEIPEGSDFPLFNVPFGICKTDDKLPFAATIIGNTVIDLFELSKGGFFNGIITNSSVFNRLYLNCFIDSGKSVTRKVRERIIELFSIENTEIQFDNQLKEKILTDVSNVKNLLPVQIGDYTDFYSSKEHATNVGVMFRDPANALLPNWKHIPVGYHGRSSSIVISGTNIHRPKGQTMPNGAEKPVFGPSQTLDFELEMAFITGKKTELGQSVKVNEAEDYIFGMVIFNDLSARDIQKWEYVPLGPFLSKNFGSVISPWIVTLEALEPFRTASPVQEPKVLPYLKSSGKRNFDISLEVHLKPENNENQIISRSNFKYMYWNMSQQLAHQTVNGCNINVGDLYGSGTISGPTPDSFGSMLELTWNGANPLKLNNNERKFIEDFDTITMKAYCENNDLKLGFGDCITKILPAL